MMRDMKNEIVARVAVAPEVLTGNRTGAMIDLIDANRMAFVVTTGDIAGAGDFSVKVQESDTTTAGDFTDAPAEHVLTDAPDTLAANAAYRVSYIGCKRHVRLIVTKASGTSIAVSAVAVLGDLAERPAD